MSVDFILPNRNKIQTIAYASKKYAPVTESHSWRRPKSKPSSSSSRNGSGNGSGQQTLRKLRPAATSNVDKSHPVLRNANNNNSNTHNGKMTVKSGPKDKDKESKRGGRAALKREIIELDEDEGNVVAQPDDEQQLEWSAAQSLVQMNSKQERRLGTGAATGAVTATGAGAKAVSAAAGYF